MKFTKYKERTHGLSQSQLAFYLGVSRSLICHFESYTRQLPTAALIKLSQLERECVGITTPVLTDACVSSEKQQFRKLVAASRRRHGDILHKLYTLKKRLQKTETAMAKSIALLKTSVVIARRYAAEPSKQHELSLSLTRRKAEKLYNDNSPLVQASIRLEMESLEAQAKIQDAFIRKHSLKLAAPVKIQKKKKVIKRIPLKTA